MTAAEARLPGHWLSEAAQLGFFDLVLERSIAAERAAGTQRYRLELAGTRIALSFAGAPLAQRFLPALAHLLSPDDASADVTFHIWDSESTGVAMPPPPCKRECLTDRGDIWGMNSERVLSAFHWSEFSVNLLDLARGEGVFWVQSERQLPYWTTSSPLRTLLHWWMRHRGAQLLHAAAVGDEHGCLLITGQGGVGKSTAALACLRAGMQYVADDYLVVRLDPVPIVHSLYCTAKLEPAQLVHFPELEALIVNRESLQKEKAVVRLFPELSSRLARVLPLTAIATPSFAESQGTTIGGTDPARLERAAAFTTMSQLPHAGRATHAFIQRMVAALPGLELRLGQDLAGIPRAIGAYLKAPASERAPAEPRPSSCPVGNYPLISVIIPVYNGARFLEEAIRNVLEQGIAELEIIVVDDGSTDSFEEVLQRLPVTVRCFRQENAGAAGARNRGIRESSGELLAFLDVDDLWPARNLTLLRDLLLADSALDLVHGRAQLTRYQPGEIGDYVGDPGKTFNAYIGAGLYRRRAFERIGWFDTELRYGEDADWFNRAAECELKIERLREVTLFVRRHDANMTRGKNLVELNLLRVLRKQLDRRSGPGRDTA